MKKIRNILIAIFGNEEIIQEPSENEEKWIIEKLNESIGKELWEILEKRFVNCLSRKVAADEMGISAMQLRSKEKQIISKLLNPHIKKFYWHLLTNRMKKQIEKTHNSINEQLIKINSLRTIFDMAPMKFEELKCTNELEPHEYALHLHNVEEIDYRLRHIIDNTEKMILNLRHILFDAEQRINQKQTSENNNTFYGEYKRKIELYDEQLFKICDDEDKNTFIYMHYYNLRTIRDVLEMGKERIMKLKGFGKKRMAAIERILKKTGFEFGMKIPDDLK